MNKNAITTPPRLIDDVDRMRAPVKERERMSKKVTAVTAAEMFNPHTQTLYLTEFHELPERVRNHPIPVQKVFMACYNIHIRRWGDVNQAMKAAWKAAETKIDQLKKQASEKPSGLLPRRERMRGNEITIATR